MLREFREFFSLGDGEIRCAFCTRDVQPAT
jgi:hypothetical protein